MRVNFILVVFVLLVFGSCRFQESRLKHVFYIHGRIIEQQGKNAISEKFGKYEFDAIIAALKVPNSKMHYEIRSKNVEPRNYAKYISKQIDSLIQLGVKPIDITVVGASKGAIIAAHISDMNASQINYVLLAGNNEYQQKHNNWKFHGQVLCIFDSSDDIAGSSYHYWNEKENDMTVFQQLELKTKRGHGFLYKPLDVWIKPSRKWILQQKI